VLGFVCIKYGLMLSVIFRCLSLALFVA